MEPCRGIMKAFPKVKRVKALQGNGAPPVKKKLGDCDATGDIFNDVNIFILPAGIGSARCQIFQRQIQQNGGQIESSLCPGVTHVVVDDTMDCERALRLLKVDRMPSGVQLVKCSWLSSCISEKHLLDVDSHSLLVKRDLDTPSENIKEPLEKKTVTENNLVSHQSKQQELPEVSVTLPESKDEAHREDDGVSNSDLEALISGLHPKEETPGPSLDPGLESGASHQGLSGKWVCAQSSHTKANNHNKHLTDKLEQLAKAYTHQGDRWRALGYSKAVNALKSYHKPVTSYQGFRTLEDIRTKAHLTSTQKIGLKHYDDFLDRMPREEAAAIEKVVRDAALCVDPGLVAIACGSYRRGKATCGDVDVLITHPDRVSHKGVFGKVLQILHDNGFLTDDLVSHEENGDQKKYMGVCRLPGVDRRHRRLDIIVVPYNEFACALMYFTGSAHFNRSMRALAKTKSMSLSEHSLNQSVVRQGTTKVYAGTPLHTATEKDVFNLLGIPFREPSERDW
ncbi:DNA polymerase lambda-like isoform X2 [Synchiropus splendidus]|uniref:DNA polymerase lambda-like isoform X2 n=1 Tax=Synchiropus splendidus TaxID=270530 RepID=UPI00237DC895|nr:DNA polymerase lambda-like isoform X2 [Synchiropus splendidus]